MTGLERAAQVAGVVAAGWAVAELAVVVRRGRRLGQRLAERDAVDPLGSSYGAQGEADDSGVADGGRDGSSSGLG